MRRPGASEPRHEAVALTQQAQQAQQARQASRPHRPLGSRRIAPALTIAAMALGIVSCGTGAHDDAGQVAAEQAAAAAAGSWTDSSMPIAARDFVRGRIALPAGSQRVTLKLEHAQPLLIPDACVQSTVKQLRSFIVGNTIVCRVKGGKDSVSFRAAVTGVDGERVGGTIRTRAEGRVGTSSLPERTILGHDGDVEPETRLISSPDFLNADVGNLRRGPGKWTKRRSANGTNAAYERALHRILRDWQQLDPLGVLVAGDLVNGRWGQDDHETGNFGPVDTLPERKAALRRAARTYYPQWQQRFDDHDLAVFPSVGDHEYGDNPWGERKRELVPTFREEFARAFTRLADGSSRYAETPPGQAAGTAFAGRPRPNIQLISIDPFDFSTGRARLRVDRDQLRWIEGVLRRARQDGVEWILVEGHTPIVYPVRSRASTGLHYERGTRSPLWRLMDRYDVDLYLSGEVHDTQLIERDGIVQVSHGGAFQFGLTTALVLDFHEGGLFLSLRDYDARFDHRGPRLWETKREGLPARVRTGRAPRVIGTASLTPSDLLTTSGILSPVGR